MPKAFVLRLDQALFHLLQRQAQKQEISINAHCVSLLREASLLNSRPHEALIKAGQKIFGQSLLGLILFGSVARGTANKSSDMDLLFVLEDFCPVDSGIYRKWDREIPLKILQSVPHEISPHFVHLPKNLKSAGSLWLEVSLEGKVLWTRDQRLPKCLQSLRQLIAEGYYVKSFTYGVPYWKKAG